jgi:hypothetical protein
LKNYEKECFLKAFSGRPRSGGLAALQDGVHPLLKQLGNNKFQKEVHDISKMNYTEFLSKSIPTFCGRIGIVGLSYLVCAGPLLDSSWTAA